MTLPAVLWEPAFSEGDPSFPSPITFDQSGGPTRITLENAAPVPVVPGLALDNLVNNFNTQLGLSPPTRTSHCRSPSPQQPLSPERVPQTRGVPPLTTTARNFQQHPSRVDTRSACRPLIQAARNTRLSRLGRTVKSRAVGRAHRVDRPRQRRGRSDLQQLPRTARQKSSGTAYPHRYLRLRRELFSDWHNPS